MSEPSHFVFISYSHDSEPHCGFVLQLSERLREDGIETRLDQYVPGSPIEGWPRWMLNQIDKADFVLVICTQSYYTRFRGHEVSGKGKGADWEGAVITQELYDSRSQKVKFVPVLRSRDNEPYIPEPLRSATHYVLDSEEDYSGLRDFLSGQAGVPPRPVGTVKAKDRSPCGVLRFDQLLPLDHAGIESQELTACPPTHTTIPSVAGIHSSNDPPTPKIDRDDWVRLHQILVNEVAPNAAMIAELPRFIKSLREANVDVGVQAVRNGLTVEDAKTIGDKENLAEFVRLLELFRTKWIERLERIRRPREEDVRATFTELVEDLWNSQRRKCWILALFAISVVCVAASCLSLRYESGLPVFAGILALASITGSAVLLLWSTHRD